MTTYYILIPPRILEFASLVVEKHDSTYWHEMVVKHGDLITMGESGKIIH